MAEFVLPESEWPEMPPDHRGFLVRAIARVREFPGLTGLAAGGSFISRRLDQYSDLDLLVIVGEAASPLSLTERHEIAGALGPLLGGFTGEHVGEPRLLICLYGPPPLHVDLKFLPASELDPRVEDPVILWDRRAEVRRALASSRAAYPQPDLQWIEDRFWIWVHYGTTKIGRGELLEALDFLSFLRKVVLGPLASQRAGARPDGVRRIEDLAPDVVARLRATVATYDPAACYQAFLAAIALYRELRAALAAPSLIYHTRIEEEAVRYLHAVGAG